MPSLTGFEAIVRRNEPLAPKTWFRLGGPAEFYAEPRSIDELAALARRCREEDLPLRLLGGGSNLLIGDAGVRGMVIHLGEESFGEIKVENRGISAGGAAKLGHVISSAVREGLAGLETLVGIPGTIGGALHGNAGTRGGDIGQWATRATVMTRSGEISQRQRGEMVFAYRESSLDDVVILSAEFELEHDDPEQLTKRMQKQWIMKKSSQPLGHQSAGCIFKNPRGMSAGMLVEQAGMKGVRIGGAEVSQRHGNFIVADPGASSQDVARLVEEMKNRVLDRLGVELELEIEVW